MLWRFMMTKNRKVVAGKTASMSMLMLGWFFILLTLGLSQTQVARFEFQSQQFFPGLYLVTLQNDRGRLTRKLVVQR